MTEKEIKISYEEYRCPEEMLPEDRELVCEAMEAMNGAYAPYSRYHVGAAVQRSDSPGCKPGKRGVSFRTVR